MNVTTCKECGRFPGCYVGRTRAREGRAPCRDWVARKFDRDAGVALESGRSFFERYGIPAAEIGRGE